MRRRRERVDAAAGEMPVELSRRPTTEAEIGRWIEPGERMPAGWCYGGERGWRRVVAHGRWSAASRAWRTERDRSYRWYWRSRDLPMPPRNERERCGEI